MQQVVTTNAERVAIARDHPHHQVWSAHLQPGGNRRGAAVNGYVLWGSNRLDIASVCCTRGPVLAGCNPCGPGAGMEFALPMAQEVVLALFNMLLGLPMVSS